ncbi:sugar phosphate isomerase/epimerase family protein [Robertkochia flava]|uniref:sugar phosphate isomerase/epimerase family protein n=1 Tax=Robertkochia flava TaxID=3447986 RepID=UPI001CCBCBDF|nr:TIM barrel protein [Robertkochia marina]
MNRRRFVRNSSQAGLALALLGLASCKNKSGDTSQDTSQAMAAAADPFFKLSLAQWSVHRMIWEGQMDPYDFAAKAKAWGFSGLEYVNHLYAKSMEAYDTELAGIEAMVKELSKRSQDQEMENLIMMIDLQEDAGALCHPESSVRAAAVTNHHKWIDAASGLGCHSARVNLFGTRDQELWTSAAVESLSNLCEYAKNQNVNVIVENHGWLSSDAALLTDVMEKVNMDNCGTLPDFGNFCTKRDGEGNWGGACVEEYDRYQGTMELMPYAKGVSAKSYAFNEKGEETTIDYAKMLGIVKDAGYTGFIGVEYEGNDLSEEEGILATKNLLINTAEQL